MAEEERYYYGRGRRKAATAQVRLYPDGGEIVVNDRPVEEFFSREIDLMRVREPLQLTANLGKYRVSALVRGGGISGQAGAVRLGIARALLEADPELRRPLRQAGLLTVDARVKERKKPGLKRARKAPQYTKR